MLLPEPPEELIKRYLQGDREACRELLKRPEYYLICKIIAKKRFLGKSKDWEDAAQVAFEKILIEALNGKFKEGNLEKFNRWCSTVALNAIRDSLRKLKIESEFFKNQSSQINDNVPDIREDLETLNTNTQIQKAIISIDLQNPNKQFLQIWQGLKSGKKQTEIAQDLGLKQAEVSKRFRELSALVGKELGWLNVKQVEEMLKTIRQGRKPKRSQEDWDN
ncbi:putative RNA polymerase sigma factor, sigma-70 family [Planktothrix serta PCC 8927]|uniref:RNA polymerase sigma factor, sigma-70 family n=1 Tax=Planktothrix serta PCC 8927 TaxID=671068 RepID=A0A7Z9BWJ3_9CYAN|nr:sigma-70 family RNA polymerase sigma factor [Planktothrix serta]VXD24076.1 putative RNA polymerase sigma factor, sigma-70 family [Planktothrix serta PCC 8927]